MKAKEQVAALILFFICVLLGAPPSAARAAGEADRTVEAVGSSRIQGGNASAAYSEAVAAGLIAAVSRALGESLPRDVLMSHFQVINDRIFRHTDEFVNDYKVLSESKAGDNYAVMVEATVTTARLLKTLSEIGIQADQKSLPRVLICVARRQAGDTGYRYWWGGRPEDTPGPVDEALAQALQAAGFTVVRSDPIAELAGYPADLDAERAVILGRRVQADVVVAGQAQVEEVQAGDARSFRGLVDLRAYLTDSGKQAAASSKAELAGGEDPKGGPRQALVSAAAQAGQDISTQLRAAWLSPGAARSQIDILVSGTGGHVANLVKLRGALSRMSGVANVQIKEMRPDAAVLAVEYQGTSRSLVDALLLQSFDSFGVGIGQIGPDSIDMKLVPR